MNKLVAPTWRPFTTVPTSISATLVRTRNLRVLTTEGKNLTCIKDLRDMLSKDILFKDGCRILTSFYFVNQFSFSSKYKTPYLNAMSAHFIGVQLTCAHPSPTFLKSWNPPHSDHSWSARWSVTWEWWWRYDIQNLNPWKIYSLEMCWRKGWKAPTPQRNGGKEILDRLLKLYWKDQALFFSKFPLRFW